MKAGEKPSGPRNLFHYQQFLRLFKAYCSSHFGFIFPINLLMLSYLMHNLLKKLHTNKINGSVKLKYHIKYHWSAYGHPLFGFVLTMPKFAKKTTSKKTLFQQNISYPVLQMRTMFLYDLQLDLIFWKFPVMWHEWHDISMIGITALLNA